MTVSVDRHDKERCTRYTKSGNEWLESVPLLGDQWRLYAGDWVIFHATLHRTETRRFPVYHRTYTLLATHLWVISEGKPLPLSVYTDDDLAERDDQEALVEADDGEVPGSADLLDPATDECTPPTTVADLPVPQLATPQPPSEGPATTTESSGPQPGSRPPSPRPATPERVGQPRTPTHQPSTPPPSTPPSTATPYFTRGKKRDADALENRLKANRMASSSSSPSPVTRSQKRRAATPEESVPVYSTPAKAKRSRTTARMSTGGRAPSVDTCFSLRLQPPQMSFNDSLCQPAMATWISDMDWTDVWSTREVVDYEGAATVKAWLIPDGLSINQHVVARVPLMPGVRRAQNMDEVDFEMYFDAGRGIGEAADDASERIFRIDRYPLDEPRDLDHSWSIVVAPQDSEGPHSHPVNHYIGALVPELAMPWRGNVLIFRHGRTSKKVIVGVEDQYWMGVRWLLTTVFREKIVKRAYAYQI
ncbi:hypothetical protein B0H15DRAFT_800340 [Mycena belliarum]|nr:hypothetical protein B0H15DRAFT_800340 [Mycena belliae]